MLAIMIQHHLYVLYVRREGCGSLKDTKQFGQENSIKEMQITRSGNIQEGFLFNKFAVINIIYLSKMIFLVIIPSYLTQL